MNIAEFLISNSQCFLLTKTSYFQNFFCSEVYPSSEIFCNDTRIFQIPVRSEGDSPKQEGDFLLSSENLRSSDFDQSNLFSKIKKAFCEYWTSVKTKISMTCGSKKYAIKTKMVHKQWGGIFPRGGWAKFWLVWGGTPHIPQ